MGDVGLFPVTLEEARKELFEQAANPKGASCPCCDRFCKIYKRKLNITMARSLIWLFNKTHNSEFVHVASVAPRFVVATNQLPSTRWWDLSEPLPSDGPIENGKKTSGCWRITGKGISFVRGDILVPKYCFTYDGSAVEVSDDRTDIQEALGEPFNYFEMMRAPGLIMSKWKVA